MVTDPTAEELGGVLRAGYRAIIVDIDEWRPLADHVLALIRAAAQAAREEAFKEAVEGFAVPQWYFSLHRLLTGEWQASLVDEANSRSGHYIADTALEAIEGARAKAKEKHNGH